MTRLISIFAILLSAGIAKADLMLEPYIGYEQGQVIEIASSGDLSAKTSGLQGGLRVGYALPLLFWAALDYSMTPSGQTKADVVGSSVNFKRSDLYLTAGIDLPILLRVWAGYGLMNSMTQQQSGGDVTFKGGTNLKLGVGFKIIPLLTLYVEGYQHKSATVDGPGGSQDVSTFLNNNSTTYQDGGLVAGVSFPIDL